MKIRHPLDHLALKYMAKRHGIDNNALACLVENYHTISDAGFNSYYRLRAIRDYELHELNTGSIIDLLEIFERLITTHPADDTSAGHLIKIVTELTNLVRLVNILDSRSTSNIKYHTARLKSESLNPDHISSGGFSQEGEDLILKRLFPEKTDGFFVDIGAHHPTRFSNTYLLYKRGWRGINIDPLPGTMDLFRRMRPEDINIETAIGDGQSTHSTAHYVCFREPAYNSIYFDDIENVENVGKSDILEIIEIPVRTLDNVLTEHSNAFDHINLLSIDVEGLEQQVLDGFSINRYKPDVIIIEIRGFDLEARHSFEVYNFLANNGYKLRSLLYNSLVLTRNDI